ncbi:MAG TPA: hypothetical protein VNM91_01600 [Dehalococcoidia bacterium]|nr:hypothetical protein [Dehalococcoidia bacterium]
MTHDSDTRVSRWRAIEQAWSERGWPPELLAEAREAHVPASLLERLPAWATPERIEDEVRWARVLAEGRVHVRQLTVADGDAFAELWANSPEEIGEWDVTAERGPNAFAQFELQERPVLHGLFDGHVMVACVSFSLRPTIVGGQRLWVRYGQAMRVHREHRRHGYAHWVRSLRDFYVLERGGEIVACAGLWDRGRDVRERWRHRETGAERAASVTALLDSGYAEGHEDALAGLIEHLVGVTHMLGRDFLVAPMESLDGVAALLAGREQVPETRYLQWRTDRVALKTPPYLDLVYW